MEKTVNFRIVRDEAKSAAPTESAPALGAHSEVDTIRVASEQLKRAVERERLKKEALETSLGELQGQYEGILHSAQREKIKILAERNTLEDSLKLERQRAHESERSLRAVQDQVKNLEKGMKELAMLVAGEGQDRQKTREALLGEIKALRERFQKETIATREQTAEQIHRLDETIAQQTKTIAHQGKAIDDVHSRVSRLLASLGSHFQRHTESILNKVKGWTQQMDEKWELRTNRRLHEAFHELTTAVTAQIQQEVQGNQVNLEEHFAAFERKLEREVQVLFGNQNLIQNGFNHLVHSIQTPSWFGKFQSRADATPKSDDDELPSHRRSQEYIQERLARLRREEAQSAAEAAAKASAALAAAKPAEKPAVKPPPAPTQSQPRTVTPPPFRGKKTPRKPIPGRPDPISQ